MAQAGFAILPDRSREIEKYQYGDQSGNCFHQAGQSEAELFIPRSLLENRLALMQKVLTDHSLSCDGYRFPA